MQTEYDVQKPPVESQASTSLKHLKKAAAEFLEKLTEARSLEPSYNKRKEADDHVRALQTVVVEKLCKWIETL